MSYRQRVKKKNIKNMKKRILPILAGLVALSSCEGFLDATNIYSKDLNSFYSNPTEIAEGVAGMYHAMYNAGVTSDENVSINVLDDLTLGGGESGGESSFFLDKFTDPSVDYFHDAWKNAYNGINRASALIERLTAADFNIDTYFSSEAEADAYAAQALGEAYFMRGYFYLRLGRMFGGVPIIATTASPRDVPRSSYTETFTQAASDFKLAIEAFPNKAATAYATSEYGHANRWIAQGYIARAYMHYTGYMTNIESTPTSTLPLNDAAGGGELAKADVVAYLEDCIANSGYALLTDFRSLWPYSYVNYASAKFGDAAGENKLPWANAENLQWAGQDGFTPTIEGTTGNSEVMFSVRYAFGNWGVDQQQRVNKQCLYFGLRDNTLQPFGQGWGHGTVHPGFVSSWDDADLRKEGSVLATGDAENGTAGFEDKGAKQYSGYVNKKYQTLVIDGNKEIAGTTFGGAVGMFEYIYNVSANGSNDMQLRHAQDHILLRFADILLMKDELTETNTGMTALRDRAGLDPVPYTLEALKAERMYEFAFEAVRWYDLVRWGDVYSGNNYYVQPVNVMNNKIEEAYSITPPAAQKGLLPIPETEVSISNGVYTENAGW